MPLLNRNIQVFVKPGLLPKEGVNAPSAINPHFNAHREHRSVEIKDID